MMREIEEVLNKVRQERKSSATYRKFAQHLCGSFEHGSGVRATRQPGDGRQHCRFVKIADAMIAQGVV